METILTVVMGLAIIGFHSSKLVKGVFLVHKLRIQKRKIGRSRNFKQEITILRLIIMPFVFNQIDTYFFSIPVITDKVNSSLLDIIQVEESSHHSCESQNCGKEY